MRIYERRCKDCKWEFKIFICSTNKRSKGLHTTSICCDLQFFKLWDEEAQEELEYSLALP